MEEVDGRNGTIGCQNKPFFLFSVDTEPDAPRWSGYSGDLTFRNFRSVPALLTLLREYGIKASFFVTCSSAKRPVLRDALEPALSDGVCEIGAHFHPGDTLPQLCPGTDNALELTDPVLDQKLTMLHETVTAEFGRPVIYRAGGWSVDSRQIAFIDSNGYIADSSVTPGVSWNYIGRPSYFGACRGCYHPDRSDPARAGDARLLEVPVTIGAAPRFCGMLPPTMRSLLTMPLVSRIPRPISVLRNLLPGYPRWLRPAFTGLRTMTGLALAAGREFGFAHAMCHSNELGVGTSPFSLSQAATDRTWRRLRGLFSYASQHFTPVLLSDLVNRVGKVR